MRRTTKINQFLPDAINCSAGKNYTQIPNDFLRNPNISAKAKTILSILLSNKNGWYSHIHSLEKMMVEKEHAIRSGLKELESLRYLIRVKYKSKKTKQWVGSFWAYTDTPGQFKMQEHLKILANKGFEPDGGFPDVDEPDVGEPDLENQVLKILYNKKTNNSKNTISSSSSDDEEKLLNTLLPKSKNGYITPSQFQKFWKIYPRHIDEGKALTAWNRICNRKNNRPTWRVIKRAIIQQKKSERWQNPKFIPHPTTWLNQSRWLDDPSQMLSYQRENESKPKKVLEFGEWWYLKDDGNYYNNDNKLLTI